MGKHAQSGASLTQFLSLVAGFSLMAGAGVSTLIGGGSSLWPALAGGLFSSVSLLVAVHRRVQARTARINHYLTLAADPERAPSDDLSDPYDDELSLLGRQLNGFVEQLRLVLIEARHASGEMRQSAQSLKLASNSAQGDVNQQSHDIDQITHSIEQVASASDELSHQGQAINHTAEESHSQLDAGLSAYSASRQSIQQLNETITIIARDIVQLKQQSADIDGVLAVIGAIAEQTNLLALNAAIEAARAGDQGRGFAVVADEVRALAHRTQESTVEIQQTVAQLQASADQAVTGIGECQNLGDTSLEQSLAMETILQSAGNATSRVSELTHQVAAATQSQQSAISAINDKMLAVNQASSQFSEQLAGNTKLAQSLDAQARQVDAALNRVCV